MRLFLSVVLLLCLALPVCAEEAPATTAAAPDLTEARTTAAGFVGEWLSNLDNEDFQTAGEACLALKSAPGKDAAPEEILRGMRAGSGGLSMRAFVGSQVFALAVDDSEHQVQVTYYTQFKKKTVREVVAKENRQGGVLWKMRNGY